MNGNTKKVGFGAASIIALVVGILTIWDKGGAVLEPAVTKVITEKVVAVAKRHDEDQKVILEKIDKMKTDLISEMNENNREQIRLIVQALRSERGSP